MRKAPNPRNARPRPPALYALVTGSKIASERDVAGDFGDISTNLPESTGEIVLGGLTFAMSRGTHDRDGADGSIAVLVRPLHTNSKVGSFRTENPTRWTHSCSWRGRELGRLQ